jgi:hypothetical protein
MNYQSGTETLAVGYTGLGFCPTQDLVSMRVL